MTLHGEHVQIRAHHVACRKARGLIRRFSRPHASMKIAPGWECQLGGTGLPVLEYCASPTLAHYDRWAEAYSKTAYSHPKQAPNPSSPIEGVAWAPPPHWCSLEQKCSDEEITTHDCGQLQQDCEAPLCARSRNQYLWGVKISDEGAQKLTTDESAVGSALVDIGAGIQVQASANLAIYCGEHDFEAAKAEGAEQADRLTLTIEVPLVKSAELATVLSTVIEGAEAEDPGFAANLHTSGSVDGWGYSASAGVDGLSLSISLTPPAQAG